MQYDRVKLMLLPFNLQLSKAECVSDKQKAWFHAQTLGGERNQAGHTGGAFTMNISVKNEEAGYRPRVGKRFKR